MGRLIHDAGNVAVGTHEAIPLKHREGALRAGIRRHCFKCVAVEPETVRERPSGLEEPVFDKGGVSEKLVNERAPPVSGHRGLKGG